MNIFYKSCLDPTAEFSLGSYTTRYTSSYSTQAVALALVSYSSLNSYVCIIEGYPVL